MPQVALRLPTSIKTCRELLRGILQFVHLHGPWAVHIIEGRDGEQKLFHPAAWGCTGIIVDLSDRYNAERLLAANVPAIITNPADDILSAGHPLSLVSRVECDNAPLGRCAAEYFLERKFRHFAFIGQVNDASWSEQRRQTFSDRLAKDNFICTVYPRLSQAARKDFSSEQKNLCNWLSALPKPVAILVANDVRARQVLDSCLKAGLAVPQDVAVLGVDNDEMLCETTHPQLSSIQMSTEQAGFEAARALDGMMRGAHHGKRRQSIITYGFSHLVTRRSTETVQIADPLVARAVEFIRINAGITVTVQGLADHLNVSRRSLEIRFKSVMGHTVYTEIMRVRLKRVQTQLRDSSMTVDAIAETCGFAHASHLSEVFRQYFGMTMTAYRRQTRDAPG